MAASSKGKPVPRWVIDLHGIKEALTTKSNSVRARIIDAIASGEMLVMRSVQDELKNAYENLWPDFVAIKRKCYVDTSAADYAAATALQEMHGSGVLGGMPSFAHFEAVTVARAKRCKLVSSGKALTHCQDIAEGCGIPRTEILGIASL